MVDATDGLNTVPGQIEIDESIPLPPEMVEIPEQTDVSADVESVESNEVVFSDPVTTDEEDIRVVNSVTVVNDETVDENAPASEASLLALTKQLSVGRLTDELGVAPPYDKSRPYSKFLRNVINIVDRGDYPDIDTVTATRIHSRENAYGLWEEGGAVSLTDARVLLVGGVNGAKLVAVKSHYDDKFQCGRHSLLQIGRGYHIVVGRVKNDSLFIFDYVVDDVITKNAESDDPIVEYHLKDLGAFEGNRANIDSEWNVGEFPAEKKPEDTEFTFLGLQHPMIQAAIKRLNEVDAHTPAYIADYIEHKYHYEDYSKCIDNNEEMSNIIIADTLSEAYATMDNKLGELVDKYAKDKSYIVTVMTSMKYYTARNVIGVFLFPMVFDVRTKQIVESNNYMRIVLEEGQDITYIDSDVVVKWDEAVKYLSRAADNTAVFASRRITGKR